MDAAKATVKKFMSNDGKHDTTVHQRTAPAVQNETIARQEHERQTTAVDREVHQDHYHTTEQPVSHSERLAEQHHHNAIPVEHRSFEHDNADKVRSRLDEEQKKYYDTQERVEGEKTQSHEGTVQGEHMHHHVHETIQPVVNKQTVEPHVVHTTVPIHEVHHNEAHHHASTALPAMSMEDFKNQGGALGGRDWKETRHEAGEPQSIGGHSVRDDRGPHAGTTDHSGTDDRTKQAMTERIGTDSRTNPGYGRDGYGSNTDRVGADGRNTTGLDSYGSNNGQFGTSDRMNPNTTSRHEPGYGNTGDKYGTDGAIGSNSRPSDYNDSSIGSNTSGKKPSLMDKLNPKKDSDGDGKAGFMK